MTTENRDQLALLGQQVFDTARSGSAFTEIICHITGGRSVWIPMMAEVPGMLLLTTDGSSFNTVMEVRTNGPAGYFVLACDNDQGADTVTNIANNVPVTGKTSALSVPVPAGQTNLVFVDGVVTNGVVLSGTLNLSYSLVPVTLTALPLSSGAAHLQVSGQASLRIVIERSTNLRTWTPILTNTMTGASYDFSDTGSSSLSQGFYRVRLLP